MSRHSAELQTICKQYWQRLYNLEGDKFDLEHIEKIKAQEVNKGCKTIKRNKLNKCKIYNLKLQKRNSRLTYVEYKVCFT